MRDIPLQMVPNQSMSFTVEGARWDVTIKACGSIMAVDVVVDDVPLIQGVRTVAGADVIPFEHLTDHGNLFFITEDDDLPWWEQFGVTQFLVYLTPQELQSGIAV